MRSFLQRIRFWPSRRAVRLAYVELVGERVVLRPVERRDAPDIFGFVADPAVVRFLPWQPASRLTGVEAFLDQQQQRRREGESLAFSVIWKETGRVIGSTDIMQLKAEPGHAELGYILAQEFWGKGIMTEAATLCRDYIFRGLQRKSLAAFADHENVGSRRVLEKLGMREAGSEWRTVKEVNRLYIRYELTRENWEKLVH